MKKRGQIATEYLILIGIILLLLVPATAIYFKYIQNSNYSTSLAEAQDAVNTLIIESEELYYLPGSQKIITLNFPDRVENFTISNKELIFEMRGPKGEQSVVSKVSDVAVEKGTIDIPTTQGAQKVKLISIDGKVCITTIDGDCK
jgi:uncharacterized protein (UPF0333 family)